MSDRSLTAIDFETANGSLASVCSVGISVLENGRVHEACSSLIRPAENVSAFWNGNIAIHGIHPEDVEDAPSFTQVMDLMYPYLDGQIVCAHNARFDMGCLKAACENTGAPLPHLKWFDTVQLSRKVFPQLPHHRLNDMCSYLGIDLNHHHADSDAYGCLMIVVKVMQMKQTDDVMQMLKETGTVLHTL